MDKVWRHSKHPIPPSGNRLCLVTTCKNLRLIMYLTSLGSSCNPSSPTARACKFCNLKRDSGSPFIFLLLKKLRYLKSFKVPILSGKTSNSESDRKCLNSDKHFSKSVVHVGPTILSAKTIDHTWWKLFGDLGRVWWKNKMESITDKWRVVLENRWFWELMI